MSELEEYKLQLQQVEAALTLDPDNEDLKKLRTDLQEVINLTSELEEKVPTSKPEAAAAPESVQSFDDEDEDAPFYRAVAGTSLAAASTAGPEWKAGDKCLACYPKDSMYYPAEVDEILEDGSGLCSVRFDGYDNTEVTQVSMLRPIEEEAGGTNPNKPKSKKDLLNAQREYKKKKAEKKRQRQKQLEEEREVEKNKWLSFNAKAFSKTNKGRVKRSIFATPDSVTGRVGVGTCGMSGKGMTKFQGQEKWKK